MVCVIGRAHSYICIEEPQVSDALPFPHRKQIILSAIRIYILYCVHTDTHVHYIFILRKSIQSIVILMVSVKCHGHTCTSGELTKSHHSSVGYVSVTIPPAKYNNLSDPTADNEGSGTVTISWLEVETLDLHAHGSTCDSSDYHDIFPSGVLHYPIIPLQTLTLKMQNTHKTWIYSASSTVHLFERERTSPCIVMFVSGTRSISRNMDVPGGDGFEGTQTQESFPNTPWEPHTY